MLSNGNASRVAHAFHIRRAKSRPLIVFRTMFKWLPEWGVSCLWQTQDEVWTQAGNFVAPKQPANHNTPNELRP